MEKLLLVDDDPGIPRTLKWSLDRYELLTAHDRTSAVAIVEEHHPKVVTLDLGLPPAVDDASEGLAALDEILAIAPRTKVIVVSGNEDRDNAIAAVGRGALDFYGKPIDTDILGLIIERAFHVYQLEDENRKLKERDGQSFHGIISSSAQMLEICRLIEKIADTTVSILITGESGTGKELAARAIHDLSSRREGPFAAINCAAIPEHLLESELFGHEKGAFTGADRSVPGKIELAGNGTLFLDEIGDMPLALQAKLLRFLQEHTIERVGGRRPITVDTRVVSATHHDLDTAIGEQRFREDLYYRLSQIPVEIPALRDRGEDSVLIARHLAERFAIEQRKRPPQFGSDAVQAIRQYLWPGNVRELENKVRRAVILGDGGMITATDLDLAGFVPEDSGPEGGIIPLRESRERADRQAVEAAVRWTEGNLAAAARVLEISRPTLYNLMRQHGISLPGEDDDA